LGRTRYSAVDARGVGNATRQNPMMESTHFITGAVHATSGE
jgi:hypothetical protein